jgi:hypothetical protein
MKSIAPGTGVIATLAALAAIPVVAAPWAGNGPNDPGEWSGIFTERVEVASDPIEPGRPRGMCTPGPIRVSDMHVAPGGYLNFHRDDTRRFHELYFTRAMYSDGGRRRGGDYLGDGGPAWSIDYPGADRTMMAVAKRLSMLNACEWENPVSLADPELRRFPFLYSLEWGWANLSAAEVEGLRGYLLAGGLLMLDDFWGTWEWQNFEDQMRRVLPDHPIVEVPRDHILFRTYYDIEGEIVQVPNAGNGRAIGMGIPGARTSEQDGFEAHIRGIFDDSGRLMVVINWNTDLGDALEWAEDPRYPLHFSRFASEIFMNTIIYAMTQ